MRSQPTRSTRPAIAGARLAVTVILFALAAASPLRAQETMTFEEVSAESAGARGEAKAVRRGSRDTAPVAPVAPSPPSVVPAPGVSRDGDLVRIGSDVHVERDQVVDGDVFAIGGDIRVDGHVRGNVAATAGNVNLGATARVDGDVVCIVGELTEEDGAVVSGQRVTAMRGRGDRGERLRERLEHRRWRGDRWDGGRIGFGLSWTLFTVLVAWAMARFLRNRTRVALDMLHARPAASIAMGFLMVLLLVPSVVALALAVAVLCITIIGIPLALMLLPTYGLLLALIGLWGFTLGALVVGERLRPKVGSPWTIETAAAAGAATLGGAFLLSGILGAIPLFGWLGGLLWVVGFVAFGFLTLAGCGALLRSKFGQGPGGRWWPPFGPSGSGQWVPASPAPASPAAAPDSAPAVAPPSSATVTRTEPVPPAAPEATEPPRPTAT